MFDISIMSMIASLPGLLLALVLHEYAHAYAADRMGDLTPRMTGRLTLNPAAHIDPVGLVVLLVANFGWAKPVMINPHNFRDPRKGELLVALAGPAMNLLVAFVATFVYMLVYKMHLGLSIGFIAVLKGVIFLNVGFAIFNMLPLPPLDGSKVLMSVLPYEMAVKLASLERYSVLIFVILIMTPVFSFILIPLRNVILTIFQSIIGIIL